MWRPRRRRLRIASAQVCSLPTASTADVAAAAGEVGNSGRDVGTVGTQRVLRAQGGGSSEGLRVPVHRNDPATQRAGDHHRAEPDAAGTDHGHPFSVGDPGTTDQGTVRRGEPAPKTGCRREVDLLGNGHEVGIGGMQGDVLSERTPVGEAWLLLIGTDLGLPGPAPLTPTAATDERDGHPVADLPLTDLGPHLDHPPGELMTGHMREHDLLIMSGPRMPITPAHPGGHHSDHHPAGGGRRLGYLPNLRLGSNGIDDDGAHQHILSTPSCGRPR